MSDRFHEAVQQLRAEQFLQEKRASARGVDAVTLVNLVRAAASIEDPTLFKLASFYSPEAPMEAYIKLGGKVKIGSDSGIRSQKETSSMNKQPKKHFIGDRWISEDTTDPYEQQLMQLVNDAHAKGKVVGVKPGEKSPFAHLAGKLGYK